MSIVTVLSALLTPTIAGIATYIAWQQHATNRRQLRLALLDRRIAVFNATMNLIRAVLTDPDETELKRIFNFYSETSQHFFLFGPEIGTYIDEVSQKALKVREYNFSMDNPENPRKQTELLSWFDKQREEAKQKFFKYVAFSDAT